MTTPSRPELDAWIDPAWGQWVHDNLPTVFPSLAAAKAEFPAPADGQRGYLLDEGSTIVGKGGTWRWLQKAFPYVAGNTDYLTYTAAYTPANSESSLSINGRAVMLSLNAALVTPVTASTATAATMPAPYRLASGPGRLDFPATVSLASGAHAARGFIDSSGNVATNWAAAASAATGFHAQVLWSVTDLIPA